MIYSAQSAFISLLFVTMMGLSAAFSYTNNSLNSSVLVWDELIHQQNTGFFVLFYEVLDMKDSVSAVVMETE